MAEYRIDDLARAAGTTVRNVRVYQDRELLPPPQRRGRAALYSDAHLVRLRVIVNMLQRGYAFAQIKEMFAAWEAGRTLADVLGLEEVIGASWASEAPRHIPMKELREMFGSELTTANIKRAVELRVLQRQGTRLHVLSPPLLEAGRDLVQLGVPLSVALDVAEQLQLSVDHAAELLVITLRRYALGPARSGAAPNIDEGPQLSRLIQHLRPMVTSSLSAAAARSAEQVIPEVLGDRMIELVTVQPHEKPDEDGHGA